MKNKKPDRLLLRDDEPSPALFRRAFARQVVESPGMTAEGKLIYDPRNEWQYYRDIRPVDLRAIIRVITRMKREAEEMDN